jgi:hypothetical protein
MTAWQAAEHPSSQLFMLVGTRALLPMILGYTLFVCWTFRGNVREGEGYHWPLAPGRRRAVALATPSRALVYSLSQ